MTRPTHYLFRMLGFLVCVLLVAGALWRPLRDAFFSNPLLDGLILGILAVGILWNVMMVRRLLPEVDWVDAIRQSRTGLAALPPPRMLAPLATALGTRPDQRGNPAALSTPAMQAVLDSLSGRLDEGREVSRYLTGLLIFLGLLGTFYGLLLTVASIADVIANMSVGGGDLDAMFSQLKTGLAKPLHGMSTAFSGSLFGLASALVLGFLDLTAGQAQSRFFNELEEWLAEQTRFAAPSSTGAESSASVPAYIQALLEQTAENLESLQNLVRTSEARRERETAVLSTLSDRLEASAGQTEVLHNIERLLHTLVQNTEEGRTRMTADLRNDLRLLARTVAATAETTATDRKAP
ncbi:flagellar motor protein MotA [Acetobacter farinalis]|uniref:Flagellar motor protein MotA n=1 Tax=Acetobacter farinalis TaxID=1260984 RepID=A0ABT3Q717_9PROT|nr:flagellar motor protein MotA [Acetobacter farinalis]MCX2561072.1 flagellar motor protein MotA [Acetobacter farinalis]NHO29678.1 flagellar motor protein MotA [Acetobacter farinalis]